jgi:ADP-heptose:LPS heptosyltransferase
LFDDIISKQRYIEPEPYRMYEFYTEKKHVINCFNIELNDKDEYTQPKIYINESEDKNAQNFIKGQEKEVVLVQPYASSGGKGVPDETFRSLTIEFTERLIRKLQKDYKVFMLKGQDQKGIEGVDTINAPMRNIIALFPHVKAIVGVDSFGQHAAAAMNKPTFVFWGATREENFGYDMHYNHRKYDDYHWVPLRLPGDNKHAFEKNKHVTDFDEEDIQVCTDWVASQEQKIKPEGECKNNSCKK